MREAPYTPGGDSAATLDPATVTAGIVEIHQSTLTRGFGRVYGAGDAPWLHRPARARTVR
jgi:hypothetical protein